MNLRGSVVDIFGIEEQSYLLGVDKCVESGGAIVELRLFGAVDIVVISAFGNDFHSARYSRCRFAAFGVGIGDMLPGGIEQAAARHYFVGVAEVEVVENMVDAGVAEIFLKRATETRLDEFVGVIAAFVFGAQIVEAAESGFAHLGVGSAEDIGGRGHAAAVCRGIVDIFLLELNQGGHIVVTFERKVEALIGGILLAIGYFEPYPLQIHRIFGKQARISELVRTGIVVIRRFILEVIRIHLDAVPYAGTEVVGECREVVVRIELRESVQRSRDLVEAEHVAPFDETEMVGRTIDILIEVEIEESEAYSVAVEHRDAVDAGARCVIAAVFGLSLQRHGYMDALGVSLGLGEVDDIELSSLFPRELRALAVVGRRPLLRCGAFGFERGDVVGIERPVESKEFAVVTLVALEFLGKRERIAVGEHIVQTARGVPGSRCGVPHLEAVARHRSGALRPDFERVFYITRVAVIDFQAYLAHCYGRASVGRPHLHVFGAVGEPLAVIGRKCRVVEVNPGV